MYNSIPATTFSQKNQTQNLTIYGQLNPNKNLHARLVDRKTGYSFNIYSNTHSLGSRANNARKEAAIASRFLTDYMAQHVDIRAYHVCLKLKPNANIEQWITVRKEFYRLIREYEKKHRCIIRYRIYPHIGNDQFGFTINPHDVHYDGVAYADIPNAHRIIRRLWEMAGGHKSTVKLLKQNEIVAWSKYAAKDMKIYRNGEGFIFLMAQQNGRAILNRVDGSRGTRHDPTAGFFMGKNPNDIWKQVRKQWASDKKSKHKFAMEELLLEANKQNPYKPIHYDFFNGVQNVSIEDWLFQCRKAKSNNLKHLDRETFLNLYNFINSEDFNQSILTDSS